MTKYNYINPIEEISLEKMFETMKITLYSKLFWTTAIFVLFYIYLKETVYSYWKKHGIPQENTIVPTGILGIKFFTQKITLGNLLKSSYEKFKKYPYHGLYMLHNRILMINDPELIKTILVKDFANFGDRGLYCNTEIDPLTGHLFLMSGDKWKTLRAKLSPTFTPGKIKHMFPILREIAEEMIEMIDNELLKTNVLEMKELIARYTTDTIFSLAFGFKSNCITEGHNLFRHYGILAVENGFLRMSLGFFAPSLLTFLRIPLTDPAVSTFFIKLFQDMVKKRRAENIQRNDFLDSLIDLMDHEQIVDKSMLHLSNGISAEKIARKLDPYEAAAQAFVFFLAGFETSSTIATHCIYELAVNHEIQKKLQQEIDEFLKNPNGFNFEDFTKLEYLNMVFYEAARMHPTIGFLNRVCLNDYKMPNTDFIVPKGTGIVVSITGIHKDPNIYPEPDKFNPMRFSKVNASQHSNMHLAFGAGPRTCIGKRLGILKSKMVIFHLLANYTFSVCDKTPTTIEYSSNSILQSPNKIYLKVEKRRIAN